MQYRRQAYGANVMSEMVISDAWITLDTNVENSYFRHTADVGTMDVGDHLLPTHRRHREKVISNALLVTH